MRYGGSTMSNMANMANESSSLGARTRGCRLGYHLSVVLGDVDVLVLTALKEELDALLLVTEGVSASWTVDDAGGVPVYRAVLEGGLGSIKVVATHQTKMAGSATAALAATLAERLKPACLVMCGVCAGHPTDTELGDVVLADRVFQHDEGKNRAEGFQADLWVDSLREDWLRVAQGKVGPASTALRRRSRSTSCLPTSRASSSSTAAAGPTMATPPMSRGPWATCRSRSCKPRPTWRTPGDLRRLPQALPRARCLDLCPRAR